MRGNGLRVLGPYRNGSKWRLVVFEEGGRKAMLAASQDAAVALKARLLRLFDDRSRLPVGTAHIPGVIFWGRTSAYGLRR